MEKFWYKNSPQSTSAAGRVCVGGCSQTAGSPSWVVRIFRSNFNIQFNFCFDPSWMVKIFRSIFNFKFNFCFDPSKGVGIFSSFFILTSILVHPGWWLFSSLFLFPLRRSCKYWLENAKIRQIVGKFQFTHSCQHIVWKKQQSKKARANFSLQTSGAQISSLHISLSQNIWEQ